MPIQRHTRISASLLALAATSTLFAQSSLPTSAESTLTSSPSIPAPTPGPTSSAVPTLADPSTYTFRIDARAWYVSVAADIQAAGSTQEADLSDLNADSPRISPLVDVTLQTQDQIYLLRLNASAFDIDRSTIADSTIQVGTINAAPGSTLSTDLSLDTFQALAGARIYFYNFDDPTNDNTFALRALAGLRMYNLDLLITSGANTVDADATFVELVAGGIGEFRFGRDWSIEVHMLAGGFGGDRATTSFDVGAAFTYTLPSLRSLSAQIGYRLIINNLEDADNIEFNGSQAGLFAGLSLRF
jgi:hypothetical protein